MSADEGFEALGLVGRYIKEIKRGCPRGQFIRELPAKVAIDLDNGHQECDTQPKREHDCRRQRARTMDVGDRHSQTRRMRARQASGHHHQ
jgi:hypothetical protein